MSEKSAALPKDHKLAKSAKTMTVGVSTSTIQQGQTLNLHGTQVAVIVTDPQDTMVSYPNGAQRQFRTNDLQALLDLGVFPSSTRFTRPAADGSMETAYVELAMAAGYLMEVIGADGMEPVDPTAMTCSELIAWHMGGSKNAPERTVPGQLYVPKSDVKPNSTSEAAPDANPFEADLVKEVEALRVQLEQAHKDAEQAEINGQVRINALQREVGKLNADLLTQHDRHTTELLAKNEQIDRLEAKAAILTPVGKEYSIIIDINESDLNKLAKDGWQIQHTQFVKGEFTFNQLNVVLFRDLPAFPAPKVTATDTAIYGTPAHRPPVTQPPMPAGQSVVNLNSPAPATGRMLTNNGPKPGETKRIPTLADIQSRREQDAAEIDDIMQRGQARQEALRREFASKPSPFPVLGATS